jgi:hypothetical protein
MKLENFKYGNNINGCSAMGMQAWEGVWYDYKWLYERSLR